ATVLLVWDGEWPDPAATPSLPDGLRVLWAVREGIEVVPPERLRGRVTVVAVPGLQVSRVARIKVAILTGLGKRLLERGQKVVAITGRRPSSLLDCLMVADAATEVEVFSSAVAEEGLSAKIAPGVLDTVFQLAAKIAADGSKNKGALFVIGDLRAVRPFTVQAMINPARGLAGEQRSIFQPDLAAQLVEWSQLKGAILIDNEGNVDSAATILAVPEVAGPVPPGGIAPTQSTVQRAVAAAAAINQPSKQLASEFKSSSDPIRNDGSRQLAARGITAVTQAVAIALSARTGHLNVYHRGQLILQVDPQTM
ncbi:MAG TPA: hypothetical protein VL860_10225, partial [Planctomycetota bacterium]|nr:hypothetical protein [Planctomycetota bacterium]